MAKHGSWEGLLKWSPRLPRQLMYNRTDFLNRVPTRHPRNNLSDKPPTPSSPPLVMRTCRCAAKADKCRSSRVTVTRTQLHSSSPTKLATTSYFQDTTPLTIPVDTMAPIKSIEYFRVMPRWIFVKIVDSEDHVGWGEATLEGHTEAIEGTLDGFIKRFTGLEADDIEQIWQLAWRQSGCSCFFLSSFWFRVHVSFYSEE